MSDAAAAPAQTAKFPAKKQKRPSKPKTPAQHPTYKDMIVAAISSLKERGGSSRQAVLKYILANYKVGNNVTSVNAHLKLALKAGAKKGLFKQSKGTGASGSFKVGEKPKKVTKKPQAETPKKKPAKKTAAKMKPAAKKPAQKKKPAGAKTAGAKETSPKKPTAKKPAAKKPATKKPAAKKPAAKKAAKK